ncbi:hypothetical protein IWW47_000128 [Coemansia sp. RSA 2052]|nr:hypothetical protein IWW47_000128 [Coemansia sp. RSA 2052]
MFPSLGLLAQIDCPHKDKCGRGSLCLYRHHRTEPANREPVKKERVRKKPVDAVQEATVQEPAPTTQPTAAVQAANSNPVELTPMAVEPTLVVKAEEPPVPGDDMAWRALTLNYDAAGPAYNSACETTPMLPQLKAIVGDKIGYAKRQRALTLIYELMSKDHSGPPWMPAKLAIEREDQIYRDSGPGTYHGKLAVCLKDLKKGV